MGRKIFISYKYSDDKVKPLSNDGYNWWITSTVRDYVDELQKRLSFSDHINKGEADGEDLSHFANSTIASKLRDKIYDSSITIVMISKGMVDESKSESEQWIPWEISYSLRESNRGGRISRANAILAVVLPDEEGTYEHFMMDNTCKGCRCRTLYSASKFKIIKDNMFNVKNPSFFDCYLNKKYVGESSYIKTVKWIDFIENIEDYLDSVTKLRDKIDEFEIVKQVT